MQRQAVQDALHACACEGAIQALNALSSTKLVLQKVDALHETLMLIGLHVVL